MKTHQIRLLILLFLSLGLTEVLAQEAVITTGGDAGGSGGSASYTVGQIAYTTAAGTNGSANQGVQQPYEFFIVGFDENPGIYLELKVYPNPTLSKITLNVGKPDPEEFAYQLYDTKGKLLASYEIRQKLTEIPLDDYSPGTYLLQVCEGQSLLKTFKVIKH